MLYSIKEVQFVGMRNKSLQKSYQSNYQSSSTAASWSGSSSEESSFGASGESFGRIVTLNTTYELLIVRFNFISTLPFSKILVFSDPVVKE